MMEEIAIYGSGGFGKEVACLIKKINEIKPYWKFIGFFDDTKDVGVEISHYGKVLGGINHLNEWKNELNVIVAIGTPSSLKKIVELTNNNKIFFPNIIHPDFKNADPESIKMGSGNIITRGCYFSCDVEIGSYNIFNASTALGHDVKVGSFNTFMPAVKISGNTRIGDENNFGVGSIVLQNLSIGNNVKIGAGSVLLTKPKNGELYMGNPAKLTKF